LRQKEIVDCLCSRGYFDVRNNQAFIFRRRTLISQLYISYFNIWRIKTCGNRKKMMARPTSRYMRRFTFPERKIQYERTRHRYAYRVTYVATRTIYAYSVWMHRCTPTFVYRVSMYACIFPSHRALIMIKAVASALYPSSNVSCLT